MTDTTNMMFWRADKLSLDFVISSGLLIRFQIKIINDFTNMEIVLYITYSTIIVTLRGHKYYVYTVTRTLVAM